MTASMAARSDTLAATRGGVDTSPALRSAIAVAERVRRGPRCRAAPPPPPGTGPARRSASRRMAPQLAGPLLDRRQADRRGRLQHLVEERDRPGRRRRPRPGRASIRAQSSRVRARHVTAPGLAPPSPPPRRSRRRPRRTGRACAANPPRKRATDPTGVIGDGEVVVVRRAAGRAAPRRSAASPSQALASAQLHIAVSHSQSYGIDGEPVDREVPEHLQRRRPAGRGRRGPCTARVRSAGSVAGLSRDGLDEERQELVQAALVAPDRR